MPTRTVGRPPAIVSVVHSAGEDVRALADTIADDPLTLRQRRALDELDLVLTRTAEAIGYPFLDGPKAA